MKPLSTTPKTLLQINGMDDSTQDLILNGQTFFDSYQKEKPKRDKEIHPFFKHRLLWAKEIGKLSEDSSSAETSPPTVVCKTPLFHPYRQRSHNPFDVWSSSQPHVYSALAQSSLPNCIQGSRQIIADDRELWSAQDRNGASGSPRCHTR